jgi:hypothetical protein
MGGHGALAGDGVDAVVRERRRHDGQVAAGDQDGALAEVQVQARFDGVADDVEVAEQVRDRAVAMAGRALRFVDLLVDFQRAPGERPKQSSMTWSAPRPSVSLTRLLTAMAPALIIGLSGRPVPG